VNALSETRANGAQEDRMDTIGRIREQVLLLEIDVIERGRTAGRRLRDRVARLRREEGGQTPTEYLMIVGLMAAVIVLVFVTFYWTNVKTAAQNWVGKVKESILGTKIK
jgi:Flp pilus assembly pilin Flp